MKRTLLAGDTVQFSDGSTYLATTITTIEEWGGLVLIQEPMNSEPRMDLNRPDPPPGEGEPHFTPCENFTSEEWEIELVYPPIFTAHSVEHLKGRIRLLEEFLIEDVRNDEQFKIQIGGTVPSLPRPCGLPGGSEGSDFLHRVSVT